MGVRCAMRCTCACTHGLNEGERDGYLGSSIFGGLGESKARVGKLEELMTSMNCALSINLGAIGQREMWKDENLQCN